VSSRSTGHGNRSARVLDVARYPRAQFVSDSARSRSDSSHEYTIVGRLSLHGVTRALQVPASVRKHKQKFVVRTRFSVRRQDFGIRPGGLLGLLVHDEVQVELGVVASPVQTREPPSSTATKPLPTWSCIPQSSCGG
jgi:polyisoprenoid-binding protein YceI